MGNENITKNKNKHTSYTQHTTHNFKCFSWDLIIRDFNHVHEHTKNEKRETNKGMPITQRAHIIFENKTQLCLQIICQTKRTHNTRLFVLAFWFTLHCFNVTLTII